MDSRDVHRWQLAETLLAALGCSKLPCSRSCDEIAPQKDSIVFAVAGWLTGCLWLLWLGACKCKPCIMSTRLQVMACTESVVVDDSRVYHSPSIATPANPSQRASCHRPTGRLPDSAECPDPVKW